MRIQMMSFNLLAPSWRRDETMRNGRRSQKGSCSAIFFCSKEAIISSTINSRYNNRVNYFRENYTSQQNVTTLWLTLIMVILKVGFLFANDDASFFARLEPNRFPLEITSISSGRSRGSQSGLRRSPPSGTGGDSDSRNCIISFQYGEADNKRVSTCWLSAADAAVCVIRSELIQAEPSRA